MTAVRLSRSIFLWFMLASGMAMHAQGIEGVLVERYHEQPASSASGRPLVTYRIYLDLGPGWSLLSVFGEKDRNLFFRTTSRFFNDTLNGSGAGELVDAAQVACFPAAIDSWLAFGFATNGHKAVPLHLDADGSILCPKRRRRNVQGYRPPLCERDGLAASARVPEVIDLYITTSYLEELSGELIETSVGAYGVMGAVMGATEENMVLIAQLTTDGELHFGVNAAVRAPDGSIVKYLAYPAAAADEVQLPALLSGRSR